MKVFQGLWAGGALQRRALLGSALLVGTALAGCSQMPANKTAQAATKSARAGEKLPDFFAQAPTLRVHDALAEAAGTAAGGVLEYSYTDAVRVHGHSCPTVAGAYLCVLRGLQALYGEALPERGDIEVLMHGAQGEGMTGVMAEVASLLTGAAGEGGFPGVGMGGRFSRKNLLRYGVADVQGVLALRRRDTGRAVQVRFNMDAVPWGEGMDALMPRVASGQADADEMARFATLVQARTRAMLLEHATDDALVQVSEYTGQAAP